MHMVIIDVFRAQFDQNNRLGHQQKNYLMWKTKYNVFETLDASRDLTTEIPALKEFSDARASSSNDSSASSINSIDEN
jgi:hypothetical protein